MEIYQPLTDAEWQAMDPLFLRPVKRGKGKPHANWRLVVNAIFFVLMTKKLWGNIPKEAAFATKSVAHRWFKIWQKTGFLNELLTTYQRLHTKEIAITFPPRRNRPPLAKPLVEPALAI